MDSKQAINPMKEIDVLMLAEAHGIDPATKGLYNFYIDCISTSQAQRTWVGLTLEDMETTHWSPDFRAGAKWAAAKLKEKNNV